jgi:hypothetical protein
MVSRLHFPRVEITFESVGSAGHLAVISLADQATCLKKGPSRKGLRPRRLGNAEVGSALISKPKELGHAKLSQGTVTTGVENLGLHHDDAPAQHF